MRKELNKKKKNELVSCNGVRKKRHTVQEHQSYWRQLGESCCCCRQKHPYFATKFCFLLLLWRTKIECSVFTQKVTKEGREREAWKKVTPKKSQKMRESWHTAKVLSEKNWCFRQSIAHDQRGTEFYFFLLSVTQQDNEDID